LGSEESNVAKSNLAMGAANNSHLGMMLGHNILAIIFARQTSVNDPLRQDLPGHF
jgi:hypothetical protein